MKFLTVIGLITMLSACSATETTACPPNDQWIEPSSGPFQCPTVPFTETDKLPVKGSRDILQPYPMSNGIAIPRLVAATST